MNKSLIRLLIFLIPALLGVSFVIFIIINSMFEIINPTDEMRVIIYTMIILISIILLIINYRICSIRMRLRVRDPIFENLFEKKEQRGLKELNEKEKETIKKLGYDLFNFGFDTGLNVINISQNKPEDYNETKKAFFDSYWNSLETHWFGLIKGSSFECEEQIIKNKEV